jgi:hypothetical protein
MKLSRGLQNWENKRLSFPGTYAIFADQWPESHTTVFTVEIARG